MWRHLSPSIQDQSQFSGLTTLPGMIPTTPGMVCADASDVSQVLYTVAPDLIEDLHACRGVLYPREGGDRLDLDARIRIDLPLTGHGILDFLNQAACA